LVLIVRGIQQEVRAIAVVQLKGSQDVWL
jgi:hypothetical protein